MYHTHTHTHTRARARVHTHTHTHTFYIYYQLTTDTCLIFITSNLSLIQNNFLNFLKLLDQLSFCHPWFRIGQIPNLVINFLYNSWKFNNSITQERWNVSHSLELLITLSYLTFLVFVYGEGWWRWLSGVGLLLKNCVSYLKFASARTRVGVDQHDVVRCGQCASVEPKITKNVRKSFMNGPIRFLYAP